MGSLPSNRHPRHSKHRNRNQQQHLQTNQNPPLQGTADTDPASKKKNIPPYLLHSTCHHIQPPATAATAARRANRQDRWKRLPSPSTRNRAPDPYTATLSCTCVRPVDHASESQRARSRECGSTVRCVGFVIPGQCGDRPVESGRMRLGRNVG